MQKNAIQEQCTVFVELKKKTESVSKIVAALYNNCYFDIKAIFRKFLHVKIYSIYKTPLTNTSIHIHIIYSYSIHSVKTFTSIKYDIRIWTVL